LSIDGVSKKLLDALTPAVNFKGIAKNRQNEENNIIVTRILLTGGPCAGKTTAIAAIT
jgi:hypothetical protein